MDNSSVNCLIIDDEALARDVIANYLHRISGIEIVAECKNANEALNYLNKDNIDLIFLDISMPGISGISLAKSLNNKVKIIFTTAHREYAVEGFELDAIDYLLKPISFERILKAVNSFKKLYFSSLTSLEANNETQTDFLFIRSNRKMVKIFHKDIFYIESIGDYLKIHISDKNYITRQTISRVEKKLPNSDFLRIHRSFIVAIRKIKSYTKDSILIADTELSISRSYKKDVIERLENF